MIENAALKDLSLYLNGVSVSFDGFRAINSLSIMVTRGELLAIIGPNGAGKTTMMDIITGKTRPDSGDVIFNGKTDLTKHSEAEIANLGVGRKFQKPTVVETLTVFENLELALKGNRGVFASLFYRMSGADQTRIKEILELIVMLDRSDWLAGNLSHGQKQWLEIGMLMIQDPEVLLIDEPAAGMTDDETAKTASLLKQIAGKYSVVVVEHDMEFIKALESRVLVLHEGSVLAEGSLDQVQQNQQVIDVYLGR